MGLGVGAVSKSKRIGVEALICTMGITGCAEEDPGVGTEATNVGTMAGSKAASGVSADKLHKAPQVVQRSQMLDPLPIQMVAEL